MLLSHTTIDQLLRLLCRVDWAEGEPRVISAWARAASLLTLYGTQELENWFMIPWHCCPLTASRRSDLGVCWSNCAYDSSASRGGLVLVGEAYVHSIYGRRTGGKRWAWTGDHHPHLTYWYLILFIPGSQTNLHDAGFPNIRYLERTLWIQHFCFPNSLKCQFSIAVGILHRWSYAPDWIIRQPIPRRLFILRAICDPISAPSQKAPRTNRLQPIQC